MGFIESSAWSRVWRLRIVYWLWFSSIELGQLLLISFAFFLKSWDKVVSRNFFSLEIADWLIDRGRIVNHILFITIEQERWGDFVTDFGENILAMEVSHPEVIIRMFFLFRLSCFGPQRALASFLHIHFWIIIDGWLNYINTVIISMYWNSWNRNNFNCFELLYNSTHNTRRFKRLLRWKL